MRIHLENNTFLSIDVDATQENGSRDNMFLVFTDKAINQDMLEKIIQEGIDNLCDSDRIKLLDAHKKITGL